MTGSPQQPLSPTTRLHNGVDMPRIGLGVWQAKNGREVQTIVTSALENGYRMIDTASAYGNERGVGKAIQASNIPRSDIFITSKLWNHDQGYDQTLAAFDRSLGRLGLEYLDLYLIHWPMPAKDTYIQTWKAMERLLADGKVRAIGVSNFTPQHLSRLMSETTIMPAVNQIEIHPYFQQAELRAFCHQHGVAVESWSPLGGTWSTNKHRHGQTRPLDDPLIASIASKYSVSSAQVIIRWHLQLGLIVIPKSLSPDRVRQNYQVFDFSLDESDMAAIATLETGKRIGADPNTANFAYPTRLIQLAHNLRLIHW